jgi:hypothetical protein
MQQDEKIKNKNKGGIMNFKFVTPFAKTRKQKGQTTSKKTNTPNTRERKFVNGIGQWSELL